MQKLLLSLAFLLPSCSTTEEAWDDEYFERGSQFSWLELSCDEEAATNSALRAIAEKKPEHLDKVRAKGFTVFKRLYGDFNGVTEHRNHMKSILGFKRSDTFNASGVYFEESVTVVITSDCEIQNVSYFKGKIQQTI